jgi:hypothetical protein
MRVECQVSYDEQNISEVLGLVSINLGADIRPPYVPLYTANPVLINTESPEGKYNLRLLSDLDSRAP